MSEFEVLQASDMSIAGNQFGVVIEVREKGQSDLIHLYTEDGENYFYQQSFAAFWLKDMIKVLTEAQQMADCEVVFK